MEQGRGGGRRGRGSRGGGRGRWLAKDRNFLEGRHLLSVNQFNREQLDSLFAFADKMKADVDTKGGNKLLKGKVLATLFYEASTRTSSSFQVAMLRLGGTTLPVHDVKMSSVSKGETLEDTVRCLQSYVDIIALRHPEVGSAARAAKVMSIPLVNAGDGIGEHPTQALLDGYTILKELGALEGITVTMVGDLKNGRTVHSLARLLSLYNVKLNYVAPAFLQMPVEVQSEVAERKIEQKLMSDLGDVIATTDVLYVTRIQKERFEDLDQYRKAESLYRITPALLRNAKPTVRILHPLPRVNEIDSAVDEDPRAAYFRQMRYGLFVRMALLAMIFGHEAKEAKPKPKAKENKDRRE